MSPEGEQLHFVTGHATIGNLLFLLIHIWLTPSEGPKDFVKESDHGSWTIK